MGEEALGVSKRERGVNMRSTILTKIAGLSLQMMLHIDGKGSSAAKLGIAS